MQTTIRTANIFLFSLLIALSHCSLALAQTNTSTPKQEVRAVWITTVNGLDWPKSTDPAEQQRSLREMVMKLHSAHFNTIFFQVRGRGDALYRSSLEPWSDILTGTLGKDPGWDPLQFVIDEAHARAMEVHAWFNTFYVRSGKGEIPPSKPRHVALEHPDWVQTVDGQSWLDPGLPAVRNFLLRVGMEIVRNYDVDGVQFDFARYPGIAYPDEKTYKKYGNGTPKDDWRRENVTKFIRAFYDSAAAARPAVKIGSAPIGIYTNVGSAKGLQGYSDLYQDSRAWLREFLQDYIVPQVYWSLGDQRADPDFSVVAKDWSEHSYGRHVYVGIGAYKPDVHQQMPALIDASRSLGVRGNSFFRYENIADALDMGARYRTPANVPPMPWKNARPPGAPTDLAVENVRDGIFHLLWAPPSGAGAAPAYYNVYRSLRHPVDIDNASNLLAILPARATEYLDTIAQAHSPKYYYAVSALDRGNNESLSTSERSVIIPEIAAVAKSFELQFGLGNYYPDPASSVVFFRYTVAATAPVFLKILDESNQEVATVVDAVQGPGNYIAAADLSALKNGRYTYMLIAGNEKQKKALTLKN